MANHPFYSTLPNDSSPIAVQPSISAKKVIVGLSGGVDSSVAAWLLQQHGYQVEALFMKNWEEDDNDHYCAAAADLADAQSVCDRLAIPLHTVNFAAEYWDEVFEHFLAGYRNGQTPNPDILCNKAIKFAAFLNFARNQLQADAIATGHYVRRQLINGHYQLLRGVDPSKDQSYFLYTLNQTQISHSLFPLGNLHKSTVRNLARRLGLVTAEKKDSTGICFIGQRRFRDFLARYLKAQPGNIENTEGQILGKHPGLIYYTLGQRQGLGIGGTKPSQPYPWYVAEKDVARNVLVVTAGQHHPQQQANGLQADQLHWIHPHPPSIPLRCTMKIRYRQQDLHGQLIDLDQDRITVLFDQTQIAVTPGQSVVFYQKNVCLGGAVITKRLHNTIPSATMPTG